LAAAAALTVAACGGAPVTSADNTRTPVSSGSPASTDDVAPTAESTEEEQMRVRITIGDQRFSAQLDDSAASRDLDALLPLTVKMTDHGGVEKTGRLPGALSLDGQPAGADPDVGDVGYYAPGNELVLYYGDMSYYDGIVVLGHLADDAAERIAAMEGPVTATVESFGS
jgi:hypothetical protein